MISILNNADNVIAWAEGQGEDPQKNDFVIFLGGSQGVDQKLIVAPGIAGYPDLKGKVFAVDAPTTGYAIVGVYILKKHGLEWNRDYTFKSFGNTTARADAMSRGDAAGAMMSLADDEIQKRNFKVLAARARLCQTLRPRSGRDAARVGQRQRRSRRAL